MAFNVHCTFLWENAFFASGQKMALVQVGKYNTTGVQTKFFVPNRDPNGVAHWKEINEPNGFSIADVFKAIASGDLISLAGPPSASEVIAKEDQS